MKGKNNHKKAFVNLNHARTQEQVKVMTQIIQDGVCPFCPQYLLKYHSKPIIKETTHWFLTENMSPYEGTAFHLMLISKRHFTMPGEMKATESTDLFKLIGWTTDKFKINGGALLIRFGENAMTGGSVDHFHVHIIVGEADQNDKDADKIKIKVGYKKK
ncbi:MAG: HIT domain-containing protein [Patescibacteria group bacterium]